MADASDDGVSQDQQPDRTLEELQKLMKSQEDCRDVLENLKRVMETAQERHLRRCEHLNRLFILKCIGRNTQRRDGIPQKAPATFGWIVRNPELVFKKEPALSISFSQWLETGHGIFHIVGKPGSGKSTLMKHLGQHKYTTSLLQAWSRSCGTRHMVHAEFFFWKKGTWLENSIEGLVRGLLYEILQQVPHLIPILFPEHWHPNLMESMSIVDKAMITEAEISKIFGRLVSSPTEFRDISICLFVDGLDEYDDNSQGLSHRDLAQMLLKWVTQSSGRVKLCVSSREWIEFDVFSKTQKITLQNLTRRDMTIFVRDRLGDLSRFAAFEEADYQRCLDLKEKLVSKADGVFLWIALVVRSLEKGIIRGDSLDKLNQRVEEIPPDMRGLLLELLDSIEDCYKREVYLLLGVAMRASGSALFLPNDKIMREKESTWRLRDSENGFKSSQAGEFITTTSTALLFEAIDHGKSIRSDPGRVGRLPFHKKQEKAKKAVEQVRGRCYGLLEAMNGKIRFSHRSIPEVLQDYLPEKASKFAITDLMIGDVMCWMLLSEAKHCGFPLRVTSFDDGAVEYNKWRLRTLMSTLRLTSLDGQVSTFLLLEALDRQLLVSNFALEVFEDRHWRYVRPEVQTSCGVVGDAMMENQWDNHLCTAYTPLVTTSACLNGLHEFIQWRLERGLLQAADGHLARHMLFNCIQSIAAGPSLSGMETLNVLFRGGVSPMCLMGLGNNARRGIVPGWPPIWHFFLQFVLAGSYSEFKRLGSCRSHQSLLYWSVVRSWATTTSNAKLVIFSKEPGVVVFDSEGHAPNCVVADGWWRLVQRDGSTIYDLARVLGVDDDSGERAIAQIPLDDWADSGGGLDWDHVRQRRHREKSKRPMVV